MKTPAPNEAPRLKIPLLLEGLLHDRFGIGTMAYVHDSDSLRTWRRCIGALFDSFEKSIRDTVIGDEPHKADLREWCRLAAAWARKSESKEELVADAVANLGVLCYRLLGDQSVEDVQMGRRRGSRSHNWSLGRHRSILYASTPKQTEARIADHILETWKEDSEGTTPSQRLNHMRRGCRNASEFVERFRREYPDEFVKIFIGAAPESRS